MHFRTGLFVVALIGFGVSIAADPDSQTNGKTNSSLELRCRTVGEEEMVEVKFSDVTFIAAELSFLHDNGGKTVIQAKNGKVKIQSTGNHSHGSISGTRIETVFPSGIVSRRPKLF